VLDLANRNYFPTAPAAWRAAEAWLADQGGDS
jgi:hypothetical protein